MQSGHRTAEGSYGGFFPVVCPRQYCLLEGNLATIRRDLRRIVRVGETRIMPFACRTGGLKASLRQRLGCGAVLGR